MKGALNDVIRTLAWYFMVVLCLSEVSVEGSEDIWFINYYSPFCSHCHDLAPTVSIHTARKDRLQFGSTVYSGYPWGKNAWEALKCSGPFLRGEGILCRSLQNGDITFLGLLNIWNSICVLMHV